MRGNLRHGSGCWNIGACLQCATGSRLELVAERASSSAPRLMLIPYLGASVTEQDDGNHGGARLIGPYCKCNDLHFWTAYLSGRLRVSFGAFTASHTACRSSCEQSRNSAYSLWHPIPMTR